MANNNPRTSVCTGCGRDSASQFAWLIEGDGCYWDGKFLDGRGFTRNVNDAVHFATSQSADLVKFHLLQAASFALRTTQHGWINGEHRD